MIYVCAQVSLRIYKYEHNALYIIWPVDYSVGKQCLFNRLNFYDQMWIYMQAGVLCNSMGKNEV